MDRTELNDYLPEQSQKITRFLKNLGASKWDAEDVTQETLLRAWKHSDTLTPEILDQWMYTVARNVFIDMVRKNKRTDMTLDAYKETTDGCSKLGRPEEFITKESVKSTLAKIPPLFGKALEMRYNEDLTGKDIAKLLNVGENTAKGFIFKGKTYFKKIWETEYSA